MPSFISRSLWTQHLLATAIVSPGGDQEPTGLHVNLDLSMLESAYRDIKTSIIYAYAIFWYSQSNI